MKTEIPEEFVVDLANSKWGAKYLHITCKNQMQNFPAGTF